ncbi:TPA: hypothetical protein NIA45_004800 [Pseudomonas aeruginosa]|nr:hypothetical protein [Pseudomonas aeruginosa]
MKTLPEMIIERATTLPEGGVLSPKEFLGIGSRAAVDQAFSRLARASKLMRVARGYYVAPVHSRFGSRPPAPEKVVHALASKTQETYVKSGAKAANELGLTTQMPVQQIFLTAGRSRVLQVGTKSKVTIKHAARWEMALGAGLAGDAIRALHWMGAPHASAVAAKLHKRLSLSEWREIESVRSMMPGWMAEAIGRETLRA